MVTGLSPEAQQAFAQREAERFIEQQEEQRILKQIRDMHDAAEAQTPLTDIEREQVIKELETPEIQAETDTAADRVDQIIESVRNGRSSPSALDSLSGSLTDKNTLKYLLTKINTFVTQTLHFYKRRPDFVSQGLSNPNQKIVTEFTKDSFINLLEISPHAAPYVNRILQKALRNGIADPLTNVSHEDIKAIGIINKSLQGALIKTLIEASGKPDTDPDVIRFRQNVAEQEISRSMSRLFENDWNNTYGYFLNEQDKPLVEALYDGNKFIQYVKEKREAIIIPQIRAANPGIDETSDDFKRLVAEALTRYIQEEIIFTYEKLVSYIDKEGPEVTSQEVFQKHQQTGLYGGGLSGALTNFQRAVGNLKDSDAVKQSDIIMTREMDTGEGTKDVTFTMTDNEGKTVERTKQVKTYDPTPVIQNVSLAQGVEYLSDDLSTYYKLRVVLHDGRATLTKYEAEQGYWGTMTRIAQEIDGEELSHMAELPDADIREAALQLYTRYLEKEFSERNWSGDMGMYQVNEETKRTEMEEKILQQLRIIFKDFDSHNPDRREARLRAALSMAGGAAWTIWYKPHFITASADSVLDKYGKPEYKDAIPGRDKILYVLDISRGAKQWQAKDIWHLALFTVLDGYKKIDNPDMWDHMDIIDLQDRWRQSFREGRQALEVDDEVGTLVIDTKNFFGLGDIMRKTWAIQSPLRGHYSWEHGSQKVKLEETWQAMEHVGFDALKFFMDDVFDTESASVLLDNTPERREFFKFLYRKHYGDDPQHLDEVAFQRYYEEMKGEADQRIEKKIKNKMLFVKNDADKQQKKEEELCKLMMSGALARILMQSSPTKQLRLERDRKTWNGQRAWTTISRELANDPRFAHLKSSGEERVSERFKQVLDDVLLAETYVRHQGNAQVSERMRQKQKLPQINDIDYRLTKDRLQASLDELIPAGGTTQEQEERQQRIDTALGLYDILEREHVQNNDFLVELGDEIRNGEEYMYSIGSELNNTNLIDWKLNKNILTRTVGEFANAEKLVDDIVGYGSLLIGLAKSPPNQRDYQKIVEVIKRVQTQINQDAGLEKGLEVAEIMAKMAITFFRKDTAVRGFIGDRFRKGYNSLASHYLEPGEPVWEWEAQNIHEFIGRLAEADIFSTAINQAAGIEMHDEKIEFTIPIINKKVEIPLPWLKKEFPAIITRFGPASESMLKKRHGAGWQTLGVEGVLRYGVPAVLIALLVLAYDAFEKESEKDSLMDQKMAA